MAVQESQEKPKFINANPQQNLFEFGPIKFDSRFDSGNLSKVTHPDSSRVFICFNIVRFMDIS